MPDMTNGGDRRSPKRRDRPAPPRLTGWRSASAGLNLMVSLTCGGIVGAVAVSPLGVLTAGLLAWVVTAVVFLASTGGIDLETRRCGHCVARRARGRFTPAQGPDDDRD